MRLSRNRRHNIHIINPLRLIGGSELRALSLYRLLKDHCQVSLWSKYEPDPTFLEEFPIKKIDSRRLKFPKTGTFIFVGTYFRGGRWVYLSCPRRVILINNMSTTYTFHQRLQQLSVMGLRKVEVVHASKLLESRVRYPGVVEVSPIDIEIFKPACANVSCTTQREFTVGRLSRDTPDKHHADDPEFYQRLAKNHAFHIKLMGANCLIPGMRRHSNITFLDTGEKAPQQFLQSLDCFFYRTSEEWLEPFGRVVIEAMACGLPVVCHNRGGYVEVIDHGHNGYLFESEEEALEILIRLKTNPVLRKSIGEAARKTVEELFSPARRAEMIRYYTA